MAKMGQKVQKSLGEIKMDTKIEQLHTSYS